MTTSTVNINTGTAPRGGLLRRPGNPGWDTARAAWNLTIDQQPAAVALPRTPEQVRSVIAHAAARGLTVAPQSTGHGAAPLGELGNTILLKTTELQDVRVDPSRQVVRVGGGVTWAGVSAAARRFGLAGLYGTDDSVGVAGYTLGGGVSWFGRRHGLACSSVTAVEIVTGDGRLRRVDAEHDPELFWALRGGGGGFGVVTALEFRLFPIVDVTAGSAWYPLQRAEDVLSAYHCWVDELDDRATTAIRVMRMPDQPGIPDPLRGRAFVVVQGTFAAAGPAVDSWLAPLRGLAPTIDTFARTTSDAVSAVHLAPPGPTHQAGDGMILDDLPPQAISTFLGQVGADASTAFGMVELRQLTGALGRPHPAGGALDRLPGKYLVMAGAVAPSPAAAAAVRQDVRKLRSAMAPWASNREYLNFREQKTSAATFFDTTTRRKLFQVKARVDPDNIIRPNHVTWAD